MYCHLSSMSISEGDTVSRDEKTGKMGNTGRSIGPYLHFSIEKSDDEKDITLIDGRDVVGGAGVPKSYIDDSSGGGGSDTTTSIDKRVVGCYPDW